MAHGGFTSRPPPAEAPEHASKPQETDQLVEYPEGLILNVDRAVHHRMRQVPQRRDEPKHKTVLRALHDPNKPRPQWKKLVCEGEKNTKHPPNNKLRPYEVECIELLRFEFSRRSKLPSVDYPRQHCTSRKRNTPIASPDMVPSVITLLSFIQISFRPLRQKQNLWRVRKSPLTANSALRFLRS
jgi:hypothetical protein